jgi:aconitate hydratase 2/2-methylisocitrate dehydratase
MLYAYQQYLMACEKAGMAPRLLNAEQTSGLIELLQNPPPFEEAVLVELLANKVSSETKAMELKTSYLLAIMAGDIHCPIIGKRRASEMLEQSTDDTGSL